MTGLTGAAERGALDALVIAYPHVALFTAVGTDAGTGFTEVVGAGYSRFNATGLWNAAAGSAPARVTNSAAFPFGPASDDWGRVIAVGLFTFAFGGVLGAWDYLGAYPWLPATITSASPGNIITGSPHGLSVGKTCVYTTEYGGVAPSFSQGTLSGLLTVAHAAPTTIDVLNNGISVDTSSTGSGKIRKVVLQPINPAISTLIIDSGTLAITLA